MDTIYAYWDAEQIKYILDAVAIMTSMSDYTDLVKIFAIFGIFIAVAGGIAKARGEMAAQYMIFVALWSFALYIPKKDVVITDVAGGGGTYAVSNVPMGLAVLATTESHIGYWLTKTMETVFALPGTINFEKTGFMFGSRAILERQQGARFTDPNLVSSLANFTKDCIYPELNNDAALFDTVMKTGDIWGALGPKMNPALYTTFYHMTTSRYVIEPCPVAWSSLTGLINYNVENSLLQKIGQALNPTADKTMVKALVVSQLADVDQFIFGVSKTAAESVKQAAIINLLADSITFVPQMIGDTSSAQVAVASAQASAAANSSYRTMAKIAESSLPIIRNAIHIVILGLFPIVMLMIVVAGEKGGLILKQYMMALLWINLWAPIYALTNFFTSWWMSKGAVAAVQGMDPVSFASHQALMHSAISDQAVAGMLVLSVPVIAYMLVNVSAASFTSVVSGLMAPSSSAAQSAGGTVGVGNTSWGNVQMSNLSFQNRTGNQSNTAPTSVTGGPTMTTVGADGSRITTFGNGAQVLNRSQTVAQLGEMTAGVSSSVVSQAQTASKDAYQRAGFAEQARGHSLDTAFERGKDFMKKQASGTSVGTADEIGNVAQFTQANSNMQQLAKGWKTSFDMTDSERFQILSGVSVGGEGSDGAKGSMGSRAMEAVRSVMAKAGVKLGADVANSSEAKQLLQSARDYSEQSGFKDENSRAQQAGHRILTSTTSEAGTQATQGIRASLREADTASRMARQASSEAQAYELVASQTETGGSTAGIDLSNYVQARLGGAERANATLGGLSEAGKLQLAQRMAKDFVHDAADLVQTGNAELNSGLASGGPGVNPVGDAGASEAGVRSTGSGNLGRVPNGPGLSVQVSDGTGGPSVPITPAQVRAASAAVQQAQQVTETAHRDEVSAAGQGVVEPVNSRHEDPSLLTTTAGMAFLGKDPSGGNPAKGQMPKAGKPGQK